MSRKLVKDLCIAYMVGGVIFWGELFSATQIQLYLLAEIGWLLMVTYLVLRSRERWLFMILSIPIFWLVERQLILVVAMSLPYILDGGRSL
jgi:hypothetical protein